MQHHYYIASLHTWVTAESLDSAFIKFCKNTSDEETPIVIAKVNLPINEKYLIKWFLPRVLRPNDIEFIYLCDEYFNTDQLSPLSLSHSEMLGQLDWAEDANHHVF